ncbi:MAG TPA: hypothetical protein PKM43_22445 [Verrucomicrobiota bacterium]|nr:hypothetical protein [Verrucomicrobiota bacterium]HRZ36610.1 hypothetical protein [Candidatus Paceibacterota bacterium]
METDESSTGHAGVDWEAGATIRRGVQVESWLTDHEGETVFEIQTRRVGQEVADGERVPLLGATRHFEEPKVDVSRRAG